MQIVQQLSSNICLKLFSQENLEVLDCIRYLHAPQHALVLEAQHPSVVFEACLELEDQRGGEMESRQVSTCITTASALTAACLLKPHQTLYLYLLTHLKTSSSSPQNLHSSYNTECCYGVIFVELFARGGMCYTVSNRRVPDGVIQYDRLPVLNGRRLVHLGCVA